MMEAIGTRVATVASGAFVRRLFSVGGLRDALGFYGSAWLLIETATYFSQDGAAFQAAAQPFFWPLIAAGFVFALVRAVPPLSVSARIPDIDVELEVRVGDVFGAVGAKVVSVTTCFETSSERIAADSMQGQFTERFYDSPAHLGADIEQALQGVQTTDTTASGRSVYPLGTVAKVAAKGQLFYLLALTTMNEHGTARASLDDVRSALPALWRFIEDQGELSTIVIGVLGGGRGRVRATREEIVRTILRSFVAACASSRFSERLCVVIHPADYRRHFRQGLDELGRYLHCLCAYTEFKQGDDAGAGTPEG